ncbi:hypothetical protein M0R89_01465 [Halorussus limi]|uniref:CHAT domain-containing protein n=1 Tax=Halorussus limi TaxID=2938695 RepID=A0A8U0HVV8_9EURY|nr:hypothetical protein [Halorussus limi]UPV74754.1 hypothetical protein M0R89_01465 [Halorussus limi]
MRFDALEDRTGVRIFDPIESVRFELYTPESVEPQAASTDEFYFPVDDAVGFRATAVEIPKLVSTVVRRQDGEMIADATASDVQQFDDGNYLIELQSTPMKVYLVVDGTLRIVPGDESVTVKFGENRRVRVGARSFHEHPVGTITVTDDVEDAMAAVSRFGSALKTTSCERSFPTLRGYPPRIERGDSFEVSGDIDVPDTDVELVLPPERERVYPIASLAYYLGAEVVNGAEPRLVAGDFEYPLDGPDGYEATVNRVLKQVFFLDCLTRTEGYYPVDLHEREQVEPSVDLDFADLYGRPLAEQLRAYLAVPYDVLEPHVLDWHLTTDIVPEAKNAPALPHFAHELSLLRTPESPKPRSPQSTLEGIEEFTRAAVASGDFTRSASDLARNAGGDWESDDEMFQVEPAETVEHAWVGDGYPVGANKVTIDSLHREAERTPPDESEIEVHVVCNDSRMAEENVVSEFYGLRDFVNYDVSVHEELTVAELASLLESSADFLHYIGHVDKEGFRCVDGSLDADSLESVGIEAFVLNACRSYEQGAKLVEKGSRGGVVTLAEVVHSAATKVGRALARLLNSGFRLRSALSIAKMEVTVSMEYVTVGHGGLTLCEGESGGPVRFDLRKDNNEYLVDYYSYTSSSYRLGSLAVFIGDSSIRYLTSGLLGTFRMKEEKLKLVLNSDFAPVKIGDELHWSGEFFDLDV